MKYKADYHNDKENCNRQQKYHHGHPSFEHGGRHHHDLERFHKQLRFGKPLSLLFNLVFLIILIAWQGFGLLVIIVSLFMVVREFIQLNFFIKLQKRIIEPAQVLKSGIEAVSEGNFDVQLKTQIDNEFQGLLQSFNEMTIQLKEMDKIKEEYEENRKNLIANITHDIKTPLASIQGYIETINEGVITDEQTIKRYNEIILSNVNYTNKLIDDLFLFAKLDLDKIQFDFIEVNVKKYFSDLMQEMQFEVEDFGYKWIYEVDLNDISIMTIDTKRIYQAIRNIIGNAIKYGASDHLEIQVKTFEDNECCYVRIKDNGPGIPPDQLEFIFDRFYRIDQARTKDTMSTGLGLAIAKELISTHEGELSVESTLGKGTTILIRLPKIVRGAL